MERQFVGRAQKRDKLNSPGKSLRVWLTEVGLTDQPLPAGPKVCADGCTQFCQ